MKQQTRELLVTTKVAQHWHGEFEQKVDELLAIVSKVDNEQKVQDAAETLDVYRNITQKKPKNGKRKKAHADRPFEFVVFRN